MNEFSKESAVPAAMAPVPRVSAALVQAVNCLESHLADCDSLALDRALSSLRVGC